MIRFNIPILKQAKSQTITNLVCLSGEGEGSRWFAAIVKAITELKENNSLSFDRENETLTFVSRFSGKTRIVTRFGCHRVSCECGGGISYHVALFEIIKRYYELEYTKETEQIYLAGNRPKAEMVAGIRIN